MDLRIKRALKFIEENLDKDLKLEEITKYCNLSYSRLRELFRKEIKMSFSRYLIHQRIKKVKKLLREGQLEIKQISSKVSYKNISNFNHHFKSIVGISPSAYKK